MGCFSTLYFHFIEECYSYRTTIKQCNRIYNHCRACYLFKNLASYCDIKNYGGICVIAYIGDIAKDTPIVPFETPCHQIDQVFQENSSLQGIVLINQKFGAGLITRTCFYQKIGTRYGYNLYMMKSIDVLANKHPLIVDYFTSVIEVSQLAMNRPEEEIYDDIIIVMDKTIMGVVSIKNLLMKVADIQVEFASYLNPLTRLPGNKIINENITHALEQSKEFSLLYIDLDRFKAYNDYYGFKKGDEIIQLTADILADALEKGGFLGHIGGDDYIVIFNHYGFHEFCRSVIQRFDVEIKKYYSKKHLEKQFIYLENRFGEMEKIPLVTLSIAVVTNQRKAFSSTEEVVEEATRLKKMCKMKSESCFYVEPTSQAGCELA